MPQVYARLQKGDLAPSGALLAGVETSLKTGSEGTLINGGRIAGRQLVSLNAANIRNLGGDVAARTILADAGNDLQILGGSFTARDRLVASAGHDLTVQSSTVDHDYRSPTANGTVRRTDIDRIAGLYVTGGNGALSASAGNDLNLLGAAVASAGSATLSARHDLTLGTVSESHSAATDSKKNRWNESASTEVGTHLQTAGKLTLQADNDLSAQAAYVESGGALDARAGRDLSVSAGQASYATEYFHQGSGGGPLSRKTTTVHNTRESTTAIASTFSGDSVTLHADRDIAVTGSNVVATHDTALSAGRNLTIEAATETHGESHTRSTKQSGVFSSGGAGVMIGSQSLSTDQKTDATTVVKSTIGSIDGNVTLLAGQGYRQVGSDVLAPQGSIDIKARTVDILEARETSRTVTETKSKQSGLTIAVSSPVITAIQTAQQMSEAAGDTTDGRMKALAAANVGLAGYTASEAIGKAPDQLGGIGINVSIGGSKSSSKSTQTSNTAVGSNLTAGRDITITATGAGQDSDLTIRGSTVQAGNNVTLSAEDEIKLLAAANTTEQQSTNKSSSGSIGVGYNTSSGFAVTASASRGNGKANGNDTSWSNTELAAGDTLILQSGGDTTLQGAVAKADQIRADIGGDLKIESLQDTSTYRSQQQSASASISVPVAGGIPSGSIGGGNSRISSDYANVGEQSGLKAGDGGFQVDVKGNTDLKGGAITSTQAAVDNAKNSFTTGGELTLSDIQNKAGYDGKALALNIGTGFNADGSLAPQGTSAGFGKDSGSAGSTTQAGISGVAGNAGARTGDKETGIKPIFDQQQVQQEIDAQVKITQMFGQQASKAVGDYADTKLKEAQTLRDQGREQEAQDIESQWGANGTLRLAAHTLIGGLTGGASGAAGAAAGTLTAPAVAEALANAGVDGPLATAITAAASTAVGAVVGGTAGAGTALNEVANNYLTHDQIKHKKQELAEAKTEEDRQKIEARYAALDAQQRDAAAACLLSGGNNCASAMDPMVIKSVFDELKASCAAPRICSIDAQNSIRELTALYAKQDALPGVPLAELLAGGAVTLGTRAFLFGQLAKVPASELTLRSLALEATGSGMFGVLLEGAFHGDGATPASLTVAFVASALGGGIVKQGMNYGAGLANTAIPFTWSNAMTQMTGSAFGFGTFGWINKSGLTR